MPDITGLLQKWSNGDQRSFEELIAAVYDELRLLARRHLSGEAVANTLQPTALVHETFLRMVGLNRTQWGGRAHFFGAAAQVMRRVLVDEARRRKSLKRGGGLEPDELEKALPVMVDSNIDLLDLDMALEEFQAMDPERARLIELRFFGGLSVEEAAAVLGVSTATANREWALVRSWLHRRLQSTRSGMR
ncbi:MAG: sigma-70 family RNA polymerase sigma factor [Acidobacteria bacterium]|nr:sigma-70 family RNA polymerase sigma factor [Acidobacteriota bacterium]